MIDPERDGCPPIAIRARLRVDEDLSPEPGSPQQPTHTIRINAQNGRGVSRSAERASEFLSSLAARSRALCAITPPVAV